MSEDEEVYQINTRMTGSDGSATTSSATGLAHVATTTDIRVAEMIGIEAIGIDRPEIVKGKTVMGGSAMMDDSEAAVVARMMIRPSNSREGV